MIQIVPYRPEWPAEFQELRARLAAALGDLALSIDHVGSTSVPGLAAKDVIDIQVTVADLEAPLREALAGAGFLPGAATRDHAPPGAGIRPEELEKRFYRSSGRAAHLHVRKRGAFNQRYALLFRDYLRATPLARDAYGEVKKALARKVAEDVEAYYDVKDPVCDAILAGALRWAEGR
jgi:GrpB-like predicted nucleotidyltransferase (UPF0157 family)